MKRLFVFLSLLSPALAAEDDVQRAAMKFFENEVRPILVNKCYDCHSKTKQKGGLRVDHIGYLKTGGDTGPAVIPGQPEKSPLIEAVHYTNDDFKMPPKNNGGKMSDAEIATLEKWVKMGAPWPEDGSSKTVVTEGGFTEDQRKYWFFQPVKKVTPPAVKSAWVKNDIDRFIASKQTEMKLDPAPEADRHELVRRAYFDLHGLPPTKGEIDEFVNDKDPRAYEKLIDRLLASPRYGERWAQHWLDLVRYAESDGYNQDAYRTSAWPYRDYVINSLNNDKPYDQFVREHIAGDEIDPENPEVLTATQFLRMPVYEYNQRDVVGQWDIILTDMTDTTGELFLGLSMGCAHCHNHKFDPILQKDYYRLRAFFAPVMWRDDLKLGTPEEKKIFAEQQAAWEAATVTIREEMDKIVEPLMAAKAKSAIKKFNDDLQAIIAKPEAERTPAEKQLMVICDRQIRLEQGKADIKKSLKNEEAKKRYAELEEELKKFDHLKPKPLMEAFVATDAGPKAPPVSIKTRKGEQQIEPGFLSVIDTSTPKIEPKTNSTGRRTALANWITRPDNQLSTRVIVNRVWQYHFGRGIVATASDFGKLGELPTHPELLDYLTSRFVANGWHLKQLHRDIMLSATYCQTARREPSAEIAKVDPSNKYLWRFNPRRLDAEQVRDALLAVSGELDPKSGGPAEDGNGMRRSIYTMKKRNNQNELLRSLDAPAGFASTAERQSTTTPTQALQLINGDWLLARARKLAGHVATIDDAWIAVLGRPPTTKERRVAESFLKKRAGTTKPAQSKADGDDSLADFQENSPHERLLVNTSEKEGDEFTVEAVVSLDSIDVNASVRTIASRWTGGKDSVEAFGWSLGVTGEKSRFKPRNVIMQVVGEDENSNIGYQVVPSNIHIELGRRYHIAARVSCTGKNVTFTVQDLETQGAAVQSAVVPMDIRSKVSQGTAQLVIGGLSKRSAASQWHGHIEAARIASTALADNLLNANPEHWSDGFVIWRSSDPLNSQFEWSGSDKKISEANDPFRQAMNDLCQALLNTNEFFYLH